MARRSIVVEIFGYFDSEVLWKMLEDEGVNLAAMDGKTFVYGEVPIGRLGAIIERCALFGSLNIDIRGGDSNEQKEA